MMTDPTKKQKRRIEKAGDVVYSMAVDAMRQFVKEYPQFDNGGLSLNIGYNNRKRIGYQISTTDGAVIEGSFHAGRLLKNQEQDYEWAVSTIYGHMLVGFLTADEENK